MYGKFKQGDLVVSFDGYAIMVTKDSNFEPAEDLYVFDGVIISVGDDETYRYKRGEHIYDIPDDDHSFHPEAINIVPRTEVPLVYGDLVTVTEGGELFGEEGFVVGIEVYSLPPVVGTTKAAVVNRVHVIFEKSKSHVAINRCHLEKIGRWIPRKEK